MYFFFLKCEPWNIGFIRGILQIGVYDQISLGILYFLATQNSYLPLTMEVREAL